MLAKQTAPGELGGEMDVAITLVADSGTDVRDPSEPERLAALERSFRRAPTAICALIEAADRGGPVGVSVGTPDRRC